MTIENTLERIASALESLVTLQSAQFQAPQSPQQPQVPQMPTQPQAPTPSQFAPPAQQPQAPQSQQFPKSPLTDGNSVMAYCVEKYRTLGPVKGAEIQTVLAALGHTNVATLRPEQYDEFYIRVEGL